MWKIIVTVLLTIILTLLIVFFITFRNIENILQAGFVTHHHRNSMFNENYYKNFISYSKEEPFNIVHIYNKQKSDKLICYSLYGNNREKYFRFIKDNIKTQRKYLPDWVSRIYIHDKVDRQFMDELRELGIELYVIKDRHVIPGNSAGAFWRFLGMLENKHVIISDIDESLKGKLKLINRFYANEKYDVYLEHLAFQPENNFLAGRFMKKKNVKIAINPEFVMSYPVRSQYGQDEMFLAKEIYPHLSKYRIQRSKGNKVGRKMAEFIIWMKYGKNNYLEESFANYLRYVKNNL